MKMDIQLVLLEQQWRLKHNPLFKRAEQFQLPCLFVLPRSSIASNQFGLYEMGKARKSFEEKALCSISDEFQRENHQCIVMTNVNELLHFFKLHQLKPKVCILTQAWATEEMQRVNELMNVFDDAQFEFVLPNVLLDLTKHLDQLSFTYTPFKRWAINQTLRPLPSSSLGQLQPLKIQVNKSTAAPQASSVLISREKEAREHLDKYFQTEYPGRYQETRNQLMGDFFSSKFSTSLARGFLDVVEVWQAITQYELKRGANSSTEALKSELLWREFFYWWGKKEGKKLFTNHRALRKQKKSAFDATVFNQWANGETSNEFINAGMRELRETGFSSNRMRQILASFWTYNLGQDWRAGATYFESQLADYDVFNNWGNWQYIAGVGHDPRGGRIFNVEKQQKLFDPARSFQKRWRNEILSSPEQLGLFERKNR